MSRIESLARLAGVPGGYDELWSWSVTDLDGFWATVARHLGLDLPGPVLAEERMPGAVWFPEARVTTPPRCSTAVPPTRSPSSRSPRTRWRPTG